MPRTRAVVLIVVTTLCSASCGNSRLPEPSVNARLMLQAPLPLAAARTIMKEGSGADGAASPASLESMWAAQKLIRTASLRIEVDKVEEAIAKAEGIAKEVGGLLAGTKASQQGEGDQSATLTIRVPSDRFDEAVRLFRPLGKLRHEEVSTQDITKEYTDLETRLRIKRQTEQRLRQLLLERTGKLSDVLEVERELARVVEEMERLEGERRYYDQRVAVSTIVLDLYERGAVLSAGAICGVREAFRDALAALSISVAILIYLVTFLTPWLLLAATGWWVVSRVRRLRARAPA